MNLMNLLSVAYFITALTVGQTVAPTVAPTVGQTPAEAYKATALPPVWTGEATYDINLTDLNPNEVDPALVGAWEAALDDPGEDTYQAAYIASFQVMDPNFQTQWFAQDLRTALVGVAPRELVEAWGQRLDQLEALDGVQRQVIERLGEATGRPPQVYTYQVVKQRGPVLTLESFLDTPTRREAVQVAEVSLMDGEMVDLGDNTRIDPLSDWDDSVIPEHYTAPGLTEAGDLDTQAKEDLIAQAPEFDNDGFRETIPQPIWGTWVSDADTWEVDAHGLRNVDTGEVIQVTAVEGSSQGYILYTDGDPIGVRLLESSQIELWDRVYTRDLGDTPVFPEG